MNGKRINWLVGLALLLGAFPARAETVLLYWDTPLRQEMPEELGACRLNGELLPVVEPGRYLELTLPEGGYVLSCRNPEWEYSGQGTFRLNGGEGLLYLGMRPGEEGLEILPDLIPPVAFPVGFRRVELLAGLL